MTFAKRVLHSPLSFTTACILSFLLLLPVAIATQHSLRVGLHASWPGTSLAAEAAEWLAERDTDAFWRFLERAAAAHEASPPQTQRDEYAIVVQARGAAAAGSPQVRIADWALTARVMSPRVRVQQTLADEAREMFGRPADVERRSFGLVFANGTGRRAGFVAKAGDVSAVVDDSCKPGEEKTGIEWRGDGVGGVDVETLAGELSFEHVYPGSGGVDACDSEASEGREVDGVGGKKKFVLYADPLDDDFLLWHRPLVDAAEACKLVYVLRFYSDSEGNTGPGLQGHIVEVALKSTEYKVQDDVSPGVGLFPNCAYGSSEYSNCPLPSNTETNDAVEDSDSATASDLIEEDLIDIDGIKNLPDAGIVASSRLIGDADGSALSAILAMGQFAENLPVSLAAAYKDSGKKDEERGVEGGDAAIPSVASLRKAAKEVRSHRGLVEAVFINGRHILMTDLAEDIGRPLSCLAGLGMTGDVLRSVKGGVLASRVSSILRAQPAKKANNVRVDVTVGEAFADTISWMNNIEKDTRYAKWPPLGDGSEFVKLATEKVDEDDMYSPRSRLGGLVSFRSNMLSLVVALDLANGAHAPYAGLVDSIVRGQLPISLGIVVVPTSAASTMCAGMFYYSLEQGGLKLAAHFLNSMRQLFEYFGGGAPSAQLSEEIVEMVYMQLRQAKPSLMVAATARDVVLSNESVRERLMKAREWAETLGILPADGPAWDPLVVLQAGSSAPQSRITYPSFDVVGVLNGIVLEAVGEDTMPIAVAEQRRIATLLESGVLSAEAEYRIGSLSGWVKPDHSLVVIGRIGAFAGETDKRNEEAGEKALLPQSDGPVRLPLSLFTGDAAGSALGSVEYETGDKSNGKSPAAGLMSLVTVWLVVGEKAEKKAVDDASNILNKLWEDEFAVRCETRLAFVSRNSALGSLLWTGKGGGLLADFDGIAFAVNGVVYRRKKITSVSDLQILVAKEASTYGIAAREAVKSDIADSDMVFLATLGMRELDASCGVYQENLPSEKISSWNQLEETFSGSGSSLKSPLFMNVPSLSPSPAPSTKIGREADTNDVFIAVVVDPIGKHAVLAASFVVSAMESIGEGMVDFALLLAPAPNLPSEGPGTLRAIFSRAVFSSTPEFEEVSGRLSPPAALFKSLPQKALLTVGLVPPRAWFVAPFSTGYDLDNIVLRGMAGVGSTLHAEYSLESLIVEGSCVDENETPPQGLRLELTNNAPLQVDTLVMANLGYFQLKAPTPGRWLLDIAAGRGRDLFSIQSVAVGSILQSRSKSAIMKSAFSSDRSGRISVLVDSLRGTRSTLRVVRKKGMESEKLLDPALSGGDSGRKSSPSVSLSGMWQKLKGKDSAAGAPLDAEFAVRDGTINVFSVASGHLYERFLKIMMLSVSKHATLPVKFWLLENYLSPSFKKVIPLFAAQHGFKVEMVTYRWPSWLREQTEKQRIIWAYKILFLDVLFPLNLHRVIFVDSDSVVRSDLAELMRMDLNGAPYGFTPFCDSRKEVEGFRFWKQGFWKDTLKGAKYRISALFVVDLDRFRETSAGDTLRLIYQSLSADPNSLSNLDQDLPNYASVAAMGGADVVPIFDLPQGWLWCESWCDDASKASAKTIDLCNNPMTKEPKLVSAKRIVPEWVDLDAEVAATSASVYSALRNGRGRETRADGPDSEIEGSSGGKDEL